MIKLKSEFKKNEIKTKKLEHQFKNVCGFGQDKNYIFYGVYEYKDYEIYFDNEPFSKVLRKHISVSEKNFKKIKEKDLEAIIEHFIGENYTIQYGLFSNTVQVYEEFKTTIN